jgi:hypothetical protein
MKEKRGKLLTVITSPDLFRDTATKGEKENGKAFINDELMKINTVGF